MTNILVTGAGSVMGQSTFRALDLHDFAGPAEVHFANSEPVAAGRHFSTNRIALVATPILPLANDPDYLPAVEAYVAAHSIDIVYAGTQHELMKLAEFRDRTGKAATLSVNAATLCVDKSRTNEILSSQGLLTPVDQVLTAWLQSPRVEGDVIVKPRTNSASRNIVRIQGGFRNHKAVAEALSTIGIDRTDDFVVQSFLEGEEFTCGCYLDRFSREISVIVLRRTLTADGATLFGEIVRDKAIEAYVRGCAEALQPHGFDFGHINVQLIATMEGPVAFEINGRLSSTERPKAVLGFNSTAAYFENIVRQKPYGFGNMQQEGRFIRYYDEIYF
ncbi:ATP-grasp domain-containing protein [Nitratireductor aquimarinus]|uniref:ATP-grasp domain-containing protein n=1 Tax=Nitratireductor TaxID=245876 RepID=UPI0019D3A077|nr:MULTISPECIES: ATP-grasp domain-containing protein [Nitratireductor]MBN7777449.1 ATP-grasp domain-containing protein [Nitratireductor pacificus]MBN7781442.1 ATP-grasp domain-containing protein [Nitratireductor pacificus]MBN7790248.1 ATP-grasp domain-containing protein [Nitratireductor aquimarinus]MBY6099658.1 ATP-grasp domain-containing protein [Nitratireductor aquimarinus]MCA1261759.1 ATP-grasp domain-containing protein [Nitratireductor aquimarinus]